MKHFFIIQFIEIKLIKFLFQALNIPVANIQKSKVFAQIFTHITCYVTK